MENKYYYMNNVEMNKNLCFYENVYFFYISGIVYVVYLKIVISI